MKPIAITVVCLVALFLASCGADKYMKRGEKELALGEYFDAAADFKQAYQKTPPKERQARGAIARRMAFCYDKSLQTGKAIVAYRNAIRYKADRGTDHLALARLLMRNGNYKDAAAEFQVALDSMPGDGMAKAGLEAARRAPEIRQVGSRYTVKRLDELNGRRARRRRATSLAASRA